LIAHNRLVNFMPLNQPEWSGQLLRRHHELSDYGLGSI
jgi:hypothetical protein